MKPTRRCWWEQAPSAALTKGQVIFARAAFIGMAFHLDPHFREAAHPFRLTLQDRALIGADIAAIKIEEDAVTDIGDKIFLATRADIAGPTQASPRAGAIARIRIGTGGEQRDAGNTEEFQLHDWFPFRKIVALCAAVKA